MKSEKLSAGRPVGGKGRLAKVAIDSIQNYYGLAIRRNQGNIEGTKKSIMAIQHHISKSNTESLEQQHQQGRIQNKTLTDLQMSSQMLATFGAKIYPSV